MSKAIYLFETKSDLKSFQLAKNLPTPTIYANSNQPFVFAVFEINTACCKNIPRIAAKLM